MVVVKQAARLGMVGLGDQGRPIAMNLLAKGWPLAFHARRVSVREDFIRRGGQSLPIERLAGSVDCLLLVVVDAEQISELLELGGMLAAMRPGSIIVIHSTISPDACRALASRAAEYGVALIDAPVSGGRDRSYAGELAIFAEGDPEMIDALRPVFSAYAASVVRFGDVGAGQAAKLLNNYFYACHLETAAKATELIDALGLDRAAAAQALPRGSGASAAFAMQAARDFERTRHDRGTAHAVAILTGAVNRLRDLAGRAGVALGPTDQLVDLALRREGERAMLEFSGSERRPEK